jgi:hypothetical protein
MSFDMKLSIGRAGLHARATSATAQALNSEGSKKLLSSSKSKQYASMSRLILHHLS